MHKYAKPAVLILGCAGMVAILTFWYLHRSQGVKNRQDVATVDPRATITQPSRHSKASKLTKPDPRDDHRSLTRGIAESSMTDVPVSEVTGHDLLLEVENLFSREQSMSNQEYFKAADQLFKRLEEAINSGHVQRDALLTLCRDLGSSTSARKRSFGWALAAADGHIECMGWLCQMFKTETDATNRTEIAMRVAKAKAKPSGNLDAWGALIRGQNEPGIRDALVGALSRNGSGEIVQLFSQMIREGGDENGQQWTWWLSKISNPEAFPKLVQLAKTCDDPSTALAALTAIGQSQQPGAASVLLDLVGSANLPTQTTTAVQSALSSIRDEGNWAVVKDTLYLDGDVAKRQAAAAALFTGYAKYNKSAVIVMFKKLLNDSLLNVLNEDIENYLAALTATTKASAAEALAAPR